MWIKDSKTLWELPLLKKKNPLLSVALNVYSLQKQWVLNLDSSFCGWSFFQDRNRFSSQDHTGWWKAYWMKLEPSQGRPTPLTLQAQTSESDRAWRIELKRGKQPAKSTTCSTGSRARTTVMETRVSDANLQEATWETKFKSSYYWQEKIKHWFTEQHVHPGLSIRFL